MRFRAGDHCPDPDPDGRLGGQDRLSGPTAVAVRDHTVYITSASYLLKQDPNLNIVIARPRF